MYVCTYAIALLYVYMHVYNVCIIYYIYFDKCIYVFMYVSAHNFYFCGTHTLQNINSYMLSERYKVRKKSYLE